MNNLRLIALALATSLPCPPALAQDRRFGVQASLGAPSGDLRDTTDHSPCLGLGARLEWAEGAHGRLRARLDGMFFEPAHRVGTGVSGGVPWTRRLDTRVQGWALGLEGLATGLAVAPRLSLGAGLHAVRWKVDSTSSLDVVPAGGTAGTVTESNVPAWTKLAWSAVADVRLTDRVQAEVRLFRSPFSWEGERVNLLQFGLLWSF